MRIFWIVLGTAFFSSVATFLLLKSDIASQFLIQNQQKNEVEQVATVPPQSSKPESFSADPALNVHPERVALIIANQIGRFPSNAGDEPYVLQLATPGADAAAMRSALEEVGFTVDVAYNLDANALASKIREFKLIASRSDDALIYYTGTGVEIDGVNFFPSIDASGVLSRSERTKWFTAEDFANAVKSARRQSIVLLDGGRYELLMAPVQKIKFLREERELGLEEITDYSDVTFLYSSQSGQGAFEDHDLSYFAKAMSRVIVLSDLSFEEIYSSVKNEIEEKAVGQQTPELIMPESARSFVFSTSADEQETRTISDMVGFSDGERQHSLSDQPRIALVIGIADYNQDGDLDDHKDSSAVLEEGFAPDLLNPINDANDIASELSSIGFSTTLVENPTQTKLETALFEFGDLVAESGPDAIAVIYFAGHGVQVRGTNYLVPAGAKLPPIDYERWPQARIERQLSGFATPIHILYERFLEPSSIGVNLIILDACRNNPWERRGSGRSVGGSQGRGLADIPFRLRRSAVAFATMPGTEAEDGSADDRNSPYTSVLKQYIGSSGLPIRELFDVVGVAVEEATKNGQTPFLNSSPIGDVCLGACEIESPR